MFYFIKFGETFLKSKSTQKFFKHRLRQNLNSVGITNIQYRNSYILIKTDKTISKLQKIFGIEKIEHIKYVIDIDDNIEVLYKVLNQILLDYDFKTFRVSAKRENKNFPIKSTDLQMILGKYIDNNSDKTPSYKQFDLQINVRVLKDQFWIRTSHDSYKGMGGLPYACEGKSLCLFSGGIDSPVASFLAAKRGIKQDFLFLNTVNSELLFSQVFEIYQYLRNDFGIIGKFFSIDIHNIIIQIRDKIPNGYRQIIFKVFLNKIANLACKKLKLRTIISGENVGQVSTQTLSNLEILDNFSEVLHIRPLICFDKIEIMDIARKIGTLKMSETIKETCSIENHSNAKIKDVRYVEQLFSKLDINLDEIVNSAEIIKENINIENINKYKVNNVVGEIIDIEKQQKIPRLELGKKYTFVCSSGYKASSKMLKTREEGFDTYFLIK